SGAQMGIDQRLYRGPWPAAIRLDDRRSHLRHLPGTRNEAARGDWLHARGSLRKTAALPTCMGARRSVQQGVHGLGVPARELRQMAGARLSVGATLGRQVRTRGSRAPEVGSME